MHLVSRVDISALQRPLQRPHIAARCRIKQLAAGLCAHGCAALGNLLRGSSTAIPLACCLA